MNNAQVYTTITGTAFLIMGSFLLWSMVSLLRIYMPKHKVTWVLMVLALSGGLTMVLMGATITILALAGAH